MDFIRDFPIPRLRFGLVFTAHRFLRGWLNPRAVSVILINL